MKIWYNTFWTIAPLIFHQNRKILSETRRAEHHENVLDFIPRSSGSREMSKTKVGTLNRSNFLNCSAWSRLQAEH